MPAEGVDKLEHSCILTEDEMVDAVKTSALLGINKVRITGGEPLVKKNILSLTERISKIDGIKEVCMTTNAIGLDKIAKDLKNAGLNRLNISLDTLDPDKYRNITRRGELEDCMRGIISAIDVGFDKIKINSVLVGGFNDDEIEDLCNLTVKYPVDVRFIELMPMLDSDEFDQSAFIPYTKVLDVMGDKLSPVEKDGSVAKLYTLENALGHVGLISPVSSHFCNECNRIRITADGKIKPCLHSPGEYSIKGMDLDEMTKAIKEAILLKPQWHGQLDFENKSQANRTMNKIGG